MKSFEARGIGRWAAALAALLAGCGRGGPDLPVSEPHPGAAPPTVEGDLTFYPAPAESLLVYPRADEAPGDLELIFYRGRSVARGPDGRAYVPDPLGSRVLVVGPGMEVEGVLGGPSEADGGVGQPLAAAPLPAGGVFIADTEHEDGLLYFDEKGAYRGSAAPPVTNPDLEAGPDGHLWAARSPYVLRFEETELDAPLLYRFDPLAGTGVGIATIEPVAAPAWNRV
ncbi:MAG: hypothetical protein R3266_04830, partial [Gemmatimonadota bacterium]|nr:hypothetical protein [Gemmatimonadota bacterium]